MDIAPAELIPDFIDADEVFARAIFSPYHLKNNGKDLKPNAFYRPRDKNEVSVNRVKFCNGHFCKRKAKIIERPEQNPPKLFRGFATIAYTAISEAGAFAKSSKQKDDAAHADIFYPEDGVNEYGHPQTAEMNSIIDAFLPKSVYFPDPDSHSPSWEGEAFWAFVPLL